MSEISKNEFDYKIGRLKRSKAYLDYCEEVYGYRMYLFNMMDREQLEYVFTSIPLSSSDTLLDLGCGTGQILQALAERNGCFGIGIDQLNSDVMDISGTHTKYLRGDIDEVNSASLSPTVTIAVDSLYFSRDLEALIGSLHSIKGNKMYLFYSQYSFEGSRLTKEALKKDCTEIAAILNRLEIPYRTIEYSENERLMYERSLKALERLEEEFAIEGNADLFEEKRREQLLGRQLYATGNASRFLYITD
ncbi:MAG TPA: class I SAM-dependent methyltransferase [Spirochaetales bacterium]|nr:class I SAM-dependent methyltransferase [Spirochaetales bacterium]